MASLTELAEFVEQVLRLDTDMPVKGFDGFTIGTANEQAQVLANRTLYLKENLESLGALVAGLSSRDIVLSINKKTGAVTLNYDDIGAAAKDHKHTADDITPTEQRLFVSPSEKTTWNGKQDKLVSSESIKTILGNELLGEGNIDVNAKDLTTDENFQFISAKERVAWNNKQNPIVSGVDIATIHGYNIVGGGDVTLTADNVGADPAGTADAAVDTHEQQSDPHPQYLTEERAGDIFVEDTSANKPNGYLKLDDKGQIPAELAELFQVRYLIVGTMEERLSLASSNNVTICLQTDENRIYYLSGGDDPSEESNWHQGRDADPSAVVSVFGRSGVVTSNTGDYNADQITESETRLFVTPEQKQTWGAKQDKLVSGKNIRTINKKSLLGSTDIEISPSSIDAANRVHSHTAEEINTTSEKQFVSENDKNRWDAKQIALENGKNIKTINKLNILGDGDIEITPSSIGAASTTHTHTPDQIKVTEEAQFVSANEKASWNGKQDKLISGDNLSTVFGQNLLSEKNIDVDDIEDLAKKLTPVFQADKGIEITYDQLTDKINILNTAQGTNEGSKVTVIYVDNAKAKTSYPYTIGNKMSFDFSAYALKEEVVGEAKSTNYEYNQTLISTLPQSPLPEFDKYNNALGAEVETLPIATKADDEFYYSDAVDIGDFTGLGIDVPLDVNEMIIPAFVDMKNDETAEVDGWRTNSSPIYSGFTAWKAFQPPMTDPKIIADVPNRIYWSDLYYIASNKKETYLAITSDKKQRISGYSFQTFVKYNYVTSTRPNAWIFQGRNDDSEAWVDLDTQSGEDKPLEGNGEWRNYLLPEQVEYSQYRVLVKNTEKPTNARASIARLQLLSDPSMLIKGKDDKFYTIVDGKLNAISDVTHDTFKESGFKTSYGKIDADALKNIAPFKLCANIESKFLLNRYNPSPQITIHTALERTDYWYTLNSMSATLKVGGDEDRICVAFTPDGNKWFCLKNNVWVSVGKLTNDEDSALKVLDQGMTLRAMTAVTKEQWKVLIGSITNDAVVGVAFATQINKSSDQRLPIRLTANFDKLSNWILSPQSEVAIKLTSREIVFTPTVTAAYRFCYKFN